MHLRDCVENLVVLSAHPGLKTKKEKEERLELDKKWSEKLLTLPFETFLGEWYAQPLFHPLPFQKRQNQNPQLLAKVMLQISLAHQEYIDTFECPTLFLHGENDLKYRDLYCRLPKSTAVEQIAECGHILPLAKPSLCAEKILNWLKIHESCSSMDPCCPT